MCSFLLFVGVGILEAELSLDYLVQQQVGKILQSKSKQAPYPNISTPLFLALCCVELCLEISCCSAYPFMQTEYVYHVKLFYKCCILYITFA